MKATRILTFAATLLALTLCQGMAQATLAFDFDTPVVSQEVEVGIIAAFDNLVINNGTEDDVYTITMVKNAPQDWTATMCAGTTCYPPFITEIEMSLTAGTQEELIVDLTPGSAGTGSVLITVTSQGNPGLTMSQTFNVNTPGAGGLDFEFNAPDQGAIAAVGILESFHTTLTNNSDSDDTYTVTMVKNAPASWTSTMCVGSTCYPPFITEVEVPLSAHDQTNMDIDLTPGDLGDGSVTITVASQNNPGQSDSKNFTVVTPGLDVLLVAGDDGQGSDSWYAAALTAAGKSYGTWRRQEMGLLSNLEISQFGTVVWESGTVEEGLNNDDRAALAYFLQHGGNLFLSGQNLAYEACDLGSPYYSAASKSWFNTILLTDYMGAETGAVSAIGVDGDLVTDGMAFNLSGGDGAGNNNSLDALSVLGDGIGTLLYDTSATAATRARYGTGRSFFCGFAFEGIDTAAHRNELMSQVLAWFAGELVPAGDIVKPLLASAPYATPNPFNPQTNIRFEVGGSQTVSAAVVVYDLKGQAVRHLFQGTVSPGPQSLLWDGRSDGGNTLATGVYLARVRLADQTETVKMSLVK